MIIKRILTRFFNWYFKHQPNKDLTCTGIDFKYQGYLACRGIIDEKPLYLWFSNYDKWMEYQEANHKANLTKLNQ